MPCTTLGLPDKLTNQKMKKPAKINAAKTAQPFNPEYKNKDAASVTPNHSSLAASIMDFANWQSHHLVC